MRFCAIVLLFLLALPAGVFARQQTATGASPQVELLDSYPAGPEIVMPPGQNIWLRIGYQTAQPQRISVRPYLRGEPAKVGTSGSPARSGSGEMAAFFFFLSPAGGQVDELRVFASDDGREQREIARWPLRVYVYPGAPLLTSHEPAWVADLRAADDARSRAALAAQAQEPTSGVAAIAGSAMLFGFMTMLILTGPLLLLWLAWALWKWRGGWRLLAAIPAAVITLVILNIAFGVMMDPTSHNLFPFEILMAGLPCLLFMAVLTFLRWRQRRRIAGVAPPPVVS